MSFQLTERWNQFWFSQWPRADLLISVRVFYFCLFLIYFGQDLSGWADIVSVNQMTGWPVLPMAWVKGIEWGWKISLFMAALLIGPKISSTLSVFGAIYLFQLRVSFGHQPHQDYLALLGLMIIALFFWVEEEKKAGCGTQNKNSCRVDRYVKKDLQTVPVWPQKLLLFIFIAVFFGAGFAKVKNLGWSWLDVNLVDYVIANQYWGILEGHRQSSAIGYSLFLKAQSLSPFLLAYTLIIELLSPLALFFRRGQAPILFGADHPATRYLPLLWLDILCLLCFLWIFLCPRPKEVMG